MLKFCILVIILCGVSLVGTAVFQAIPQHNYGMIITNTILAFIAVCLDEIRINTGG